MQTASHKVSPAGQHEYWRKLKRNTKRGLCTDETFSKKPSVAYFKDKHEWAHFLELFMLFQTCLFFVKVKMFPVYGDQKWITTLFMFRNDFKGAPDKA